MFKHPTGSGGVTVVCADEEHKTRERTTRGVWPTDGGHAYYMPSVRNANAPPKGVRWQAWVAVGSACVVLVVAMFAVVALVYLGDGEGVGRDSYTGASTNDAGVDAGVCGAGIAVNFRNPRTAFLTASFSKTLALNVQRLATGDYPRVTTTCSIASRHPNGASVPVEERVWACHVACEDTKCEVTTDGTPPAPGLYTLSVVVYRADCEQRHDGRGTAALDVLVPDVAQLSDWDADGTVDLTDWCPADSTKTAPGQCGCGESDVDADDDGVADCRQQLPDTSGSPFLSPLVAVPPIVTQGHVIALSVALRSGANNTFAWSVPVGWTRVAKSPEDSPTLLLLHAPDEVGAGGVICATATDDDDTMWHACTRVAVKATTNTAPSQPVVAVTSDGPGKEVTCHITTPSVDPDGDAVSYKTSWLRDGCSTQHASNVVPAGEVKEGHVWTCNVVASDGDLESLPATAEAFVAERHVFGFVGEWQECLVPHGATRAIFKLWAGGGGGGNGETIPQAGGPGGYVVGTVPVVGGDVVRVAVGAGGGMAEVSASQPWPDGGINWVSSRTNSYGSGAGGGRSEVQLNGDTMLIAGAGGGAGSSGWGSNCVQGMRGGPGGGTVGGRGGWCPHAPDTAASIGGGGTQHEGGAGGDGHAGCRPGASATRAGAHKRGGSGLESSRLPTAEHGGGGGGGGGWYGGGCGACHTGGGGGSSYAALGRVQGVSLLQTAPFTTLLPPGTTDPDYVSPAGVGGNGQAGNAGRVVVRFE